jgi:hypothetical protein
MLIIEQHDKMHRDLRNNKGSRELSAASLEIPVSGVKQNVSNLVFSLYVGELGLDTRYSKVTASLLPQLTLLAKTTIT